MITEGDAAPTVSATIGTSDHEPFELSDHLGDGGTVVYAWIADEPDYDELVAAVEAV